MPKVPTKNQLKYQRNKAAYLARGKVQKAARVQFIRDYKTDKLCVKCGNPYHHYCLDFHHTEDNKEMGIAKLACDGNSEQRILTEIAKCILVCKNCHAEIHWKEKHEIRS